MALEDYMLSCPSKKFFGIECFGCGSQRALALLLRGEFVEAFYMFPAIYPLIVFLFFCLLNFVDRKRDYGKLIIFFAILNVSVMIISYFCKRF